MCPKTPVPACPLNPFVPAFDISAAPTPFVLPLLILPNLPLSFIDLSIVGPKRPNILVAPTAPAPEGKTKERA